jgi:hypothetical protein
MGVDFAVGMLVWQPSSPWRDESVGRIIDIRDNGVEVWVRTISMPPRVYYTFFDQLEIFSVLDQLINDA